MNVTATLIGQVIAFAVLVWFVKAFLWEPMLNMMEERKRRIADGLAAAERGQREKEKADQQVKKRLDEAKQVAAQSDIDQEINRAKESLRKQVAAIAIAGAEQVLKKEIDAKAHSTALDDLAAHI